MVCFTGSLIGIPANHRSHLFVTVSLLPYCASSFSIVLYIYYSTISRLQFPLNSDVIGGSNQVRGRVLNTGP